MKELINIVPSHIQTNKEHDEGFEWLAENPDSTHDLERLLHDEHPHQWWAIIVFVVVKH
jgi:hypothetical protein